MEREFNDLIKSKNAKILHYFELVRIWNAFTPGLLVILGGLLAGMFSLNILIIAVIFIFMYFGATTLNDIFDYHADRINSPYRPLHTKKVTFSEAYLIAFCSYIIAIILSLIFALPVTPFILLAILLSILYSAPPISLKDRVIISVLDLSFLTIFMPIFVGFYSITQTFDLTTIGFITAFTLAFASIAFLKDLKDLSGDMVMHKHTIAIMFGRKGTSYISLFGFVIFFLFAMYFFSQIIQNTLIPLIISILVISKLFLLEKKIPEKNQYFAENSFSEARVIMLIIILVIMLTLVLL
jgi:4-hydroxybenzoate polyprenyltransferase